MTFIEEDSIQIKSSPFGKGLFSTRKLSANTIVCRITGSPLSYDETISLDERESHCLQIGMDQYLLCEPPFLYSNHSCDPNCAISADLHFYTLKDIEAGEELLWDYSTSMLEKHWTMKCKCGAPQCRRTVEDFDLLPDDVQVKYIRNNIVLPFIIHELEKRENLEALQAGVNNCL